MVDARRCCTIALLTLTLAFTAHAAGGAGNAVTPRSYGEVLGEVIEVFTDIETLSKEGVNVSGPINLLNQALEEAQTCRPANTTCWEGVQARIERAKELVNASLRELPSFRLWRDLRLYGTLAFLALIPVVTYFGLPRAWAWFWVRNRRGWLVRKYVKGGKGGGGRK